MMKKWLTALLLSLALLAMTGAALAQEAQDITQDCKIKTSSSKFKTKRLTDGTYTEYWESLKAKGPYVALTAPKGETIATLYVCFGRMPDSWEVQVSDDGKKWETAVPGDTRFLHVCVALPEPSRYVRVAVTMDKKYTLRINELYAFTAGETPDWVQKWEPTHEKADIMFVSTHPDDELLFFGGGIPTYATRSDCRVVVAYFSHSNTTRSSELLNGLWHCGLRHYPDIGNFPDGKASGMKDAYKKVGGEEKVNEWLTGLYRRYRPEVVVTQDIDGEYGHTQHRIVSKAAGDAIALAADAAAFPEQAAELGAWQVKKFYRHLWPEGAITFDWSIPLESLGGRTSLEVANEAYTTFHKTQPASLVKWGEEYDNRLFGLVYTTVGPDTALNDFLENIDLTGE